MRSNTPGLDSVAGPYLIHAHERSTERFVERGFATLEALALALFEAQHPAPRWSGDVPSTRYSSVWATSARGRALDCDALIAFGARLCMQAYRQRRWRWLEVPGYVRRSGPVHGIRKRRTRKGTMSFAHVNERRAADLVLAGEGEVAPRAARNSHNLADPWDEERRRHTPRSWKSQHRGKKAWDRPM